jgi:hypothetical protein
MGGSGAMVLRYAGGTFERLPTTGLARQTVYGVWGSSLNDFYAAGSASSRNGFVWHYQEGSFREEPLPHDLPRTASGQPSGFFKVWGRGDEVWVVGTNGSILHRKGTEPFSVEPSGTKDALITVHGTGGRTLIVGGGSNGLALERAGGSLHAVSPPAVGLLQGVYGSDQGDWATGERAGIYFRTGSEAFHAVEHGLPIAPSLSFHSIFVDASGGVWAAGGNVLTPSRDDGVLVHFGASVPEFRALADEEAGEAGTEALPACESHPAANDRSIARRWNEQALAAIRRDLPRPMVHARNLFHLSAAMWDAWAAYDSVASGVFFRERHVAGNLEQARRAAVSYAAFGVLRGRYGGGPGGKTTLTCLSREMADLGYDPEDAHDQGDDPIVVGRRVARRVLAETALDGSNEAGDYADPAPFVSPNAALIYDHPGAALDNPNVWQPLYLSAATTSNGIDLPAGVQSFVGSQWGGVSPFSLARASRSVPSADAGPPPRFDPSMKKWIALVLRKGSQIDPSDEATLDISPAALGHNSLGTNDGTGWAKNPVTGKAYAPQIVRRADFGRVVAELWDGGPHAETPPGHWNVLANQVTDAPDSSRRLFGRGPELDALSWDVHVYLALNGALHDAAIGAWDAKRRTVTPRPISLIRWMGGKAPGDAAGLPIVPGLIEVITPESSAPGQRHAALASYVGQIAVRGWAGEPGDPSRQTSGVTWLRAVDWIPYQRSTIVTPPSPAFVSEHAAFGHAAAEVLSVLTGSPYFPGGLGEFVAPASTFLALEKGPSEPLRLQWASYADAADQAGESGLWRGTQIAPDDLAGRRVGYRAGHDAMEKAKAYFEGKTP